MKRILIFLSFISWLHGAMALGAVAPNREVQRHIRTILENPSVTEKEAAMEALGEIGLPALEPVIAWLHKVTHPEPGGTVWTSPDYHLQTLVTICRHAGEDAEKTLLSHLLEADQEVERECLFLSLANAAGHPKTLSYLLAATLPGKDINPNVRWSIARIVHLTVYNTLRNEDLVTDLLAVFAKYPDAQKKNEFIASQIAILKTVGAPLQGNTFSPQNTTTREVMVDEQTEFEITLPKPDGPWSYKWGFGNGIETAFEWRSFRTHGLFYMGYAIEKNSFRFRFLGTHPLKTPINIYIQGGAIGDATPSPTHTINLTVRALSASDKARQIEALRQSLDQRLRKYASNMDGKQKVEPVFYHRWGFKAE